MSTSTALSVGKRFRWGGVLALLVTVILQTVWAQAPVKHFGSPAAPQLRCSVDIPVIEADNVNLRYTPMPFDVTLAVENIGGATTDTIWATITVLPELQLAGTDAPYKFTKRLSPPMLSSFGKGTAKWSLRHPITLEKKEYTVGIWVKARNTDSMYCEGHVAIPPLDAPALKGTCEVPDSLHFDEQTGEYEPNPFIVKVKAVNQGAMSCENVSAGLYLPQDVELADTTEALLKYFNPSTLPQYKVGDPIPELTWRVRYTKIPRKNTAITFSWKVVGKHPYTGLPTDTVETYCDTPVNGVAPRIHMDQYCPDSLGLNADGTDVTPNPFVITVRVWNPGFQVAGVKQVTIYFPPEGLYLAPGQDQTVVLDKALHYGDTVTIHWAFKVQNRITRRNITVWTVAVDDEGNPLTWVCDIPIANLTTAMNQRCSIEPRDAHARYDTAAHDYSTKQWKLFFSIDVVGGFPLMNIFSELVITDPSGLDLIELDPNVPDNEARETVSVILPNTTWDFEWTVRLKNPNTTGISQFVLFSTYYGSDQTPTVEGGCEMYIEIDPVPTVGIEGDIASPSGFSLSQNRPNPFSTSTEIEFTVGKEQAPVTLVVYDALGRLVKTLVDQPMSKGRHSTRFNARGLPAGLYYCRMEAGCFHRTISVLLFR